MFMTLLVKAFAAFSPFCANMLLYMGINVVASPVPQMRKMTVGIVRAII